MHVSSKPNRLIVAQPVCIHTLVGGLTEKVFVKTNLLFLLGVFQLSKKLGQQCMYILVSVVCGDIAEF